MSFHLRSHSKRPSPPHHDSAVGKIANSMTSLSRAKDLVWVLLRIVHHELNILPNFMVYEKLDSQIIPLWSGYNNECSKKSNKPLTSVAYVPMINAKPFDIVTVFTIMKNCKDMPTALGQNFTG